MSQPEFRIYRDDRLRGSAWRARSLAVIVPVSAQPVPVEPRSVAEQVVECPPRHAPPAVAARPGISPAVEAQLLAILSSQPLYGECVSATFHRKECELGAVFAALDAGEAHALHARLAMPAATDLLASGFARLVPQRRNRLLDFLSDVRRQSVVARAGR